MACTENEVENGGIHHLFSRGKVKDVLWKVAAAVAVAILVYVLLHFASQLIELQGG